MPSASPVTHYSSRRSDENRQCHRNRASVRSLLTRVPDHDAHSGWVLQWPDRGEPGPRREDREESREPHLRQARRRLAVSGNRPVDAGGWRARGNHAHLGVPRPGGTAAGWFILPGADSAPSAVTARLQVTPRKKAHHGYHDEPGK